MDSLDGEFGEVKEFYFDDRHWTIRYLAGRRYWQAVQEVIVGSQAVHGVNSVP